MSLVRSVLTRLLIIAVPVLLASISPLEQLPVSVRLSNPQLVTPPAFLAMGLVVRTVRTARLATSTPRQDVRPVPFPAKSALTQVSALSAKKACFSIVVVTAQVSLSLICRMC